MILLIEFILQTYDEHDNVKSLVIFIVYWRLIKPIKKEYQIIYIHRRRKLGLQYPLKLDFYGNNGLDKIPNAAGKVSEAEVSTRDTLSGDSRVWVYLIVIRSNQ